MEVVATQHTLTTIVISVHEANKRAGRQTHDLPLHSLSHTAMHSHYPPTTLINGIRRASCGFCCRSVMRSSPRPNNREAKNPAAAHWLSVVAQPAPAMPMPATNTRKRSIERLTELEMSDDLSGVLWQTVCCCAMCACRYMCSGISMLVHVCDHLHLVVTTYTGTPRHVHTPTAYQMYINLNTNYIHPHVMQAPMHKLPHTDPRPHKHPRPHEHPRPQQNNPHPLQNNPRPQLATHLVSFMPRNTA